ncbi:hypothetical protein ACFLWE_00945 [Chloroflexota bacterium]
MRRQCAFRTKSGEPCRAAPLLDGDFCFMHSPEHAAEVQEARRLGGLRRKREATIVGAYEFEGLETVAGIRRLVEVAVLDTLGMENSISRNRTLAYLAQVALRTLEVGDLEARVFSLEQAIRLKAVHAAPSPFDIEAFDAEGEIITPEADAKEEPHEPG